MPSLPSSGDWQAMSCFPTCLTSLTHGLSGLREFTPNWPSADLTEPIALTPNPCHGLVQSK